jgi:hypothetical protein
MAALACRIVRLGCQREECASILADAARVDTEWRARCDDLLKRLREMTHELTRAQEESASLRDRFARVRTAFQDIRLERRRVARYQERTGGE